MVAGAAGQKLMDKLQDEQEIIMNLADMLIEGYVAESGILRVEKMIGMRGEENCEIEKEMARIYIYEAVEKAESLWAQALEARKTANALSDRAEEEAEAAASTARDAENMLKDTQSPISLEKIAQADLATKSNIDANGMVNKALEAEEEANRLESLAEEALRISEEQLSQHLVDVPDSPLAEA